MTDFAFTADVPVRFRDVDAAGHVNNAVYGTYVEQARLEYFREVVGKPLTEGAVVAHLSIDFRQSIRLDTDAVTVAVRTADLGGSSVRMAYEIRTDEGVAATAETVLVATEGGESRSIPGEWRSAIADYEGIDPGV